MPDAVQARAAALRLEASRRWLVKDELLFLLLHSRVSGLPAPAALRQRPPSGSLMLYDTREVPDYKKDGWRWQKRKDKSGRVREDRAKLVINRSVVVLGSYVHSADTATFHRRSYYLRDSNEHIVLVHYFDEVNKQQSPSAETPGRAPTVSLSPEDVGLPSITQELDVLPTLRLHEEPLDALSKEELNVEFPPALTNSTCSSSTFTAGAGGDCELDMLLKEDDALDFVDDVLYSDVSSATEGETGSPEARAQISDFSPEWDFVEGGTKILICLASPLPDVHADDASWALFVQFGQSRSPAEKLSDMVVRCTAPESSTVGGVDLFILRCHTESTTDSKASVLLSERKRFVYQRRREEASATSSTPPPLILSSLSVNSGNSSKRGRSPNTHDLLAQTIQASARGGPVNGGASSSFANLSSYIESDLDERQCKIRVVERLSEFHQAIWTRSTNSSSSNGAVASNSSDSEQGPTDLLTPRDPPSAHIAANGSVQALSPPNADSSSSEQPVVAPACDENASLDDSTIETLSDQDLEQLSEQLLERVVRQLITLAHTSDELLDELNSLDETGLNLLHYVCFYNYAQLVPVLLAHGAHINQQSTQGQTALHLAAGCGHEELVKVLLDSGADSLMVDFDGLSAADRAEKSGHHQVAATLRRHNGGSSTFNTVALPVGDLQLDDCYPMEIDDDPVLYHDYQQTPLWPSLSSSLTSSASTVASTSPVLQPAGRSHTSSFESNSDSQSAGKPSTHYADENHEHNRKFLLGAFSTMSLHDKCALSLSISRDSSGNPRRRGSSLSDEPMLLPVGAVAGSNTGPLGGSPALGGIASAGSTTGMSRVSLGEPVESVYDSDVKSVIAEDEESLNKLEAAIELMGPEERQSLEDEVKVLQHNIRAWLLRRNCRNMRETTKRLHEATKSMEDHQQQHADGMEPNAQPDGVLGEATRGSWERERAAVTVQAATRSMLARRNFLQTKHVAIKVQAATRGVLCRKHFARMKAHAQASLVIQRNVREWWHKKPAARPEGQPAARAMETDEDEEKALVDPSLELGYT